MYSPMQPAESTEKWDRKTTPRCKRFQSSPLSQLFWRRRRTWQDECDKSSKQRLDSHSDPSFSLQLTDNRKHFKRQVNYQRETTKLSQLASLTAWGGLILKLIPEEGGRPQISLESLDLISAEIKRGHRPPKCLHPSFKVFSVIVTLNLKYLFLGKIFKKFKWISLKMSLNPIL